VAQSEGIFVDQKWMDLVPGIYPSCHIFRHPGYNLAFWNLPCYSITRGDDGTVRVDGEPLAFFHFSGFDAAHPDILSKYDTRYRTRRVEPVVRDLLHDYRDRLWANGYSVCKDWPYSHNFFSDGTKISDCFRKSFLEGCFFDDKEYVGNPFDAQRGEILEKLLKPCGDSVVTGAADVLRRASPSISSLRFSRLDWGHDRAYAEWFVTTGAAQEGIDARFIEAQEQVLRNTTTFAIRLHKCVRAALRRLARSTRAGSSGRPPPNG
jgi:hypothetical protein